MPCSTSGQCPTAPATFLCPPEQPTLGGLLPMTAHPFATARVADASLDSPADPGDVATAMNIWRLLLRPGGFLLVELIAGQPQPGELSHRAAIIAGRHRPAYRDLLVL